MTEPAIENQQLVVEDVVAVLTGEPSHGEPGEGYLRPCIEQASERLDKRTADAFGRTLLDSLTEDPANLRQLEALLVLGLAHPDVLRKHQISMSVEGRRLSVLLERQGEVERARELLELLAGRLPEERSIDQELAGILRRSGNTEELIERYLGRAEDCVEDGRISEAIPWLQEILLLDRSRRDVARMIRDLRYQEAERIAKAARRTRLIALLVVISAILTVIIGRERGIAHELDAVPQVDFARPETLYARIDGLKGLLQEKRIWAGMFSVRAEITDLLEQTEAFEADQARLARQAELERQRQVEMAEAARLRGLMHFERGEYDKALEDFRRSHSLSLPGWEHRPRLEANIEALEELLDSKESQE